MSSDRIQMIVSRAEKSFNITERSNAETQWQVLSEFLIPSQSGIFKDVRSPGNVKTGRLFDSAPILANHDLATSYHATLTNPATKWAMQRFKDDELNNNAEAVAWIQEANNIFHNELNESNFDRQVSKSYQMFTALGTMAILHEVKRKNGLFDGFRFTSLHLSEIAIEENENGDVDTLHRKFELTAKQSVEKFGDEVSDEIKEAAKESPGKMFRYIHSIFPRDPDDVELDEFGLAPSNKRPFASVYIDSKEKSIVLEDGFYEFPVYAARWGTLPGEVYGRGPGHNALPDVRTLNRLKDILMHSLARAAAPPMLTTMRNIMGSLDLRPNSVSVVRDINGIREMVPQARFDVAQLSVQDLRETIKQAFFLDKLMLPPREQTGEMTAFEIQRRLEQMQRVLGPTISRFTSEFLSPLVVRSFKILLREGVLPEVPPVLREAGVDIDIVFINPLSRAQQMDSINNVQQWVQDISGLAQIKPEVLDFIDADAIAKESAKIRGVPESAVVNDDVVEQIRQQRAQQQQQQQALDAGVKAADISSKVDGGGGQGGNPFG